MHPWLRALIDQLEPHGLNHFGVVTRARYDEVAPPPFQADEMHPNTRSIVVVGSGGRAHWQQFLLHVSRDPLAHLARTSHPLDDFCRAALPSLEGCRVVFPSVLAFDFMKLAEIAGLGAPSLLGTLVSTSFGPWFGLRAAIFTPVDLPGSPLQASLCHGCAAPCRTACPVAAPSIPFEWRRCMDERLGTGSTCRSRCHARLACIVAPEHAYDDLELTYHYDRAEGRRRLCAHFGVHDQAGLG
jgi:epoxyqueuosine reductase